MEAFAAELEMDCTSAGPPQVGSDAVALVIHAAALLAVLDYQAETPDSASSSRDDIIGGLLRHEARYWQHSQARYGLNLGPAVTERAIAAGTLIGADDEAAAARLLAAIDDLADPGLRGKVARWLHDLYPAGTPGTASGEWIGPLRPDLVAENLVVEALARQPQVTSALLGGLPQDRAVSALTILARAAFTNPAALDMIKAAISSRPAELVLPAMTVAVETNRAIGDVLADTLSAGQWPAKFITQLIDALPDTSVALAGTAAIAYERLTEASASPAERSGKLLNWSYWLSRLGRREEALAAVVEAVTACRELAVARPDTFLPDLAMSLSNQSVFLSGAGSAGGGAGCGSGGGDRLP